MGKKQSVKVAKQRLLDEMATLDQKSPQYATLNQQLKVLMESEKNSDGWLWPTIVNGIVGAGQLVCSTVNTWAVLKHEDKVNVVTTKSMNQILKPNPRESKIP